MLELNVVSKESIMETLKLVTKHVVDNIFAEAVIFIN